MSEKKPATISAILTLVLLILIGVLSIFAEMLAFNGVGERRGITAMGISLVCQGAGVVLLALFARWLTDLLISKFNWNKNIAIVVPVFLGTLLGAGISFLSIIVFAIVTGMG